MRSSSSSASQSAFSRLTISQRIDSASGVSYITTSPEELLMQAILLKAFHDIGSVNAKLKEDALNYIFSEGVYKKTTDWMYSLPKICEAIGADLNAVRLAAKQVEEKGIRFMMCWLKYFSQ